MLVFLTICFPVLLLLGGLAMERFERSMTTPKPTESLSTEAVAEPLGTPRRRRLAVAALFSR